jgi:hypothetical protein
MVAEARIQQEGVRPGLAGAAAAEMIAGIRERLAGGTLLSTRIGLVPDC